MKQRYIIASGILLAILISLLVWNKQPTIFPYVLLALLAASLLSFAILRSNGKEGKFSAIFLVFLIAFLLLPNIWFISTHYAALQAGDVSAEYAIANTLADYDKVFTVPPTFDSMRPTNYSMHPLLHTLTVITGNITEIDTRILAMIMPSIFGAIGFLFVYLLISKLASALGLSKILIPISLLIYAVAPEAIFAHLRFIRQGLALLLVLILIYLIYKFILNRDWRIEALIVFNIIVLSMAHHFSAFLMSVYLLTFFLLVILLALFSSKTALSEWGKHRRELSQRYLVIGIVGILSIAAFLGWNYGAVSILRPSQEILSSFEMPTPPEELAAQERQPTAMTGPKIPMKTMAPGVIAKGTSRSIIGITNIGELEPYMPESHYPEELTPPWVHLLKIRDLLIYMPVFFGFGWLIRQKLRNKPGSYKEFAALSFFVFSLVVLGALFVFDLFVAKIVPYRIVLLSLPFIALGSSIFYSEMLSRHKWVVSGILIFVITCSFLGLWAHRVVPIHLYSSSVNAIAVGEAMPINDRHVALGQFIDKQDMDTSFNRIISEESSLLYPILPPQVYVKTGPYRRIHTATLLSQAIDINEPVAIADFGQSVYTYATARTRELDEAEKMEMQYRLMLKTNTNRIYDNGFQIWAR